MPFPFSMPTDPAGHRASRDTWSATDLDRYLQDIQVLQGVLVDEQVMQLQELSTLSRMADALAYRRNYDQVISDLLAEVTRLEGCTHAWLIECKPGQSQAMVHQPHDPVVGSSLLPRPVTLLCRYLVKHPDSGWQRVTRPAGEGGAGRQGPIYLGLPVVTNKHMVGSLVLETADAALSESESALHLIQSVCRQAAVACENDRLVLAVGEMMVEMVYSFAMAIESRDAYTGGHTQRVSAYAAKLAWDMRVSPDTLAAIRLGGLLHDIGKVAIPDAVLHKAGPLTDAEFDLIKEHPVTGYNILREVPQLRSALAVVRSHHERWDGRGYPDGLAGEDIPLAARILAVADTYDAMTSDRPYRKGWDHEHAMAEIRRCAASQFQPELAERFSALSKKKIRAAEREMGQWCRSDDRSGGLDVSSLLNLGMLKVQLDRRFREAAAPVARKQPARSRGSDETLAGAEGSAAKKAAHAA